MVPDDETSDSEDQITPQYTAEDLGIQEGEPPRPIESTDEELPPIFRWTRQLIKPFREGYTRLLRGIAPFQEFWKLTNNAIAGWFERRHVISRIIISIIGTEVLAQLFLSFWETSIPLQRRESVQPTVEIPPYVPIIIGGIAVIAFFQWLQLKQMSEKWVNQDELPPHIRVGGAVSGLVTGASLGIFFGIHGVILGVATGLVLGDEIERQVDQRINEVKQGRAQVEQTLANELELSKNRSTKRSEKEEESLNLNERE